MDKPLVFKCSFCNQEVSINQERDPEINYGNIVDCPNCGMVSPIRKENKKWISHESHMKKE
jgi:transcription elongation factor Elf1